MIWDPKEVFRITSTLDGEVLDVGEGGFYHVAGMASSMVVAALNRARPQSIKIEIEALAAPISTPETEDELRELMRDPRYWRDHEPDFVDAVRAGFAALWPDDDCIERGYGLDAGMAVTANTDDGRPRLVHFNRGPLGADPGPRPGQPVVIGGDPKPSLFERVTRTGRAARAQMSVSQSHSEGGGHE